MNVRDVVGQRLMVALPGVTALTPDVADFLVGCRAGGVVLFGFNIESLDGIAAFTRDLQDLAARNGLPPLLIAVDEEGGNVSRMPAQGQELIAPSQMAQAVAGEGAVRDCAAVTARRLRHLGFNLDLAPVMDINNNPANPVIGSRSYGADAPTVARLGGAAIATWLAHGVSPCAKHYPGHGDTNVDSHYGLPVVDKSLAELDALELVAFRAAIAAGVPAIMTAHILYPQVEAAGLPATFSPIFLKTVLRERLGFGGLVFTDCLDMQAIAARYDLGPASIMALRAGADIAMIKGPLEAQRAAFEQVVAAAEAGEIDAGESAATLERLAQWRARFALPPTDAAPPATDAAVIAAAARAGLTIRAAPGRLPLTARSPLLLDFVLAQESPVEEGRQPGALLEQHLRRAFPALRRIEIAATAAAIDPAPLIAAAAASDSVIVVTRNATRHPAQADAVRAILAAVPLHIGIAARDPHDLDLFPTLPATIATYGDPPATIAALAQVLTA